MAWEIITGDCIEEMAKLEESSVDAVVCDPPYSLPGGFMAKPWDCFDGGEDAGFAYWLAGLIDGEGHFAIKAHTRGTHAPAFTMKLRADERGTLEMIRRTMGIGSITEEDREPNPMVKWSVQSKGDCQRLVDLLDKYPLRAKKRIDYATWREAVCEWSNRPRGNRWHGAASNERMANLRERLMAGRAYVDRAWSGHEFQDWCRLWATEALRVLKPGGHLFACGGSRTHHRLVSGIEDAGFEIRDRIDCPDGSTVHTPDGTLAWYFGSGFPKSADVHKQLTKWAARTCAAWLHAPYDSPRADRKLAELFAVIAELEAPVEDAEWDGWGTALKPAHEPIVVARKPFTGTVAECVLEYGTGAINIDACRLDSPPRNTHADGHRSTGSGAGYGMAAYEAEVPAGRWPANVVFSHTEDCVQVGTKQVKAITGGTGNHNGSVYGARPNQGETVADYADEDGTETVIAWECAPGCPVAALDEQSGELKSGFMAAGTQREGIGYRGRLGNRVRNDTHGDSGGAARFFYCAKTSRAERNAGLDDLPDVEGRMRSENSGQHITRRDGDDPGPTKNNHPTVKPINLMRWLVRMVTPPGGLVLDPFTGSGSTGSAAVLEGFDFIGIEREPDYVAIAEARISFWSQHVGKEIADILGLVNRSKAAAKKHEDFGQGSLLEDAA